MNHPYVASAEIYYDDELRIILVIIIIMYEILVQHVIINKG